MSTIITITLIVLTICSIILSLFISIVYSNIQKNLNKKAANKEITLYTKPTFGLCPTEWKKNNYTNGIYCIEPGVYAIVDADNNFISARRGTCTVGKIISSTQLESKDKWLLDKQYFCENRI